MRGEGDLLLLPWEAALAVQGQGLSKMLLRSPLTACYWSVELHASVVEGKVCFARSMVTLHSQGSLRQLRWRLGRLACYLGRRCVSELPSRSKLGQKTWTWFENTLTNSRSSC